jgi:2-oxoisovalerate dehydrogenase E1 component
MPSLIHNINTSNFEPYNYSKDFLHSAYRALVFPRLIEEKMLLMLRHGRISKWFSGIGEEAISVGTTLALNTDEYICTLHRNLGVFTTRNIPLTKLFAQFQGTANGFTKGRDRTFHFGTSDYNIIGMISHLGPQLAIADGLALASKLQNTPQVTAVFTGDGGTSEGDFHEALNVAAVWKLPVIFLVVNNQYALSTPVSEQYACKDLADRAEGYGMEGIVVDGNDLLTVYGVISNLAIDLRNNPRPVLVECKTFRMRGHEEASGTKYVPKELFEYWEQFDPIKLYENKLLERSLITNNEIKEIRQNLQEEIDKVVEVAFSEPAIQSTVTLELNDVYAETQSKTTPASTKGKDLRFLDAIHEALDLALAANPNLIFMGQDIAEYGGVFKATQGFVEKYGKDRVRNTPLCESAIIGASLGLAIKNIPSMVEMQFSDFVTCGFNQIVNNLAKTHYRWGQPVNVVVRMPCGGGVAAGPFHSQTSEAWFTHCPGLKVVYPSFPDDAKGLLLRSFEDPNPVIFFEHKKLYRSAESFVPEGYYSIDFGKARTLKVGSDFTIITYGLGVHWALDYLNKNQELSCELLDLRTLLPLDYEAITEAVRKTGRVLILHEASQFSGFGGEISAYISENCFNYLDAPVMRVASIDTPIPFMANLENQYMASSRLKEAIDKLKNY